MCGCHAAGHGCDVCNSRRIAIKSLYAPATQGLTSSFLVIIQGEVKAGGAVHGKSEWTAAVWRQAPQWVCNRRSAYGQYHTSLVGVMADGGGGKAAIRTTPLWVDLRRWIPRPSPHAEDRLTLKPYKRRCLHAAGFRGRTQILFGAWQSWRTLWTHWAGRPCRALLTLRSRWSCSSLRTLRSRRSGGSPLTRRPCLIK